MKKEPNLSRRVLIYAVMTFCMTMIVWLAWNGAADSDLHKLIAEGCFYTMGFVVLFYVLGANVDNLITALPVLRGFAPAQTAQRVPLAQGRRTPAQPQPQRHPDADIQ